MKISYNLHFSKIYVFKDLTRFLIFGFLLSLFTACVGTIEDTAQKDVESESVAGSSFPFNGLISAEAVSHDKVELYFIKAPGAPADLVYGIIVNNNVDGPINVNATSLDVTPQGRLRYTVTGLTVNTLYSFKVRFKNEATGLESNQENSLTARTFANKTANFSGIAELELPAGLAGQTSFRASWIPAETTGSQFSPKSTDPVGYEIKYISAVGGIDNLNNESYTGADKVTIQLPNNISDPPSLSQERDYTVAGLDPDTQYYVQVRCIHKAYIANQGNITYKRELNTKILSIVTNSTSSEISFNDSSLEVDTPLGEDGLTKADVSWEVASGGFEHYRVYYNKVGGLGDPDTINDTLIDGTLHPMGSMTPTQGWFRVEPDDVFYRVSNLTKYDYYQFKVAVCPDFSCSQTGRVLSNMVPKRIAAVIAPFSGITNIGNPTSENPPAINTAHLTFDAPVITSGYITDLEIYCYEDGNDTSPVKMVYNTAVSASGKDNCDGLTLKTNTPASFADFEDLVQMNIEGINADGSNLYCFSAVPVIDEPGFLYRDVDNAIVRCSVPEIRTPNIIEFPGKKNGCNTTEDSITLYWDAPTAGIYSNFIVFWREVDNSNPFKFSDAIQAYNDNPDSDNNHDGYYFKDDISKATLAYVVPDLVPGKSYRSGVLSYVNYNGDLLYSESNAQNFLCTIPLPEVNFNEWVQIFAIGAKQNSLVPDWSDDEKFILETLSDEGYDNDDDGSDDWDNYDAKPVEIEHTNGTPSGGHNDRAGSIRFDGVYGAMEADTGKAKHQYSNRGIVKIAWKDVTYNGGSDSLTSLISTHEVNGGVGVLKKDRTIGYKVERSDDGQVSWIDLTVSSSTDPNKGSPFQNVTNNGLIIAKDMRYRERPDKAPVAAEKIASFIDYSVKFTEGDSAIDKARTLFYRITPMFNGVPLAYADSWQHHVVEVTLPPANMALVNRSMANRTACLEMEKIIDKSEGGFYSCSYSGLGASSLDTPWRTNESVFDLGGDLLVDRFEMGCNWTRGSIDDSTFNGVNGSFDAMAGNNVGSEDLETFKGLADSGKHFQGCLNRSSLHEPSLTTSGNSAPVDGEWNKILKGDCFGSDAMIMSRRDDSCEGISTYHWITTFSFPGADSSFSSGCLDADVRENQFDYDKFVAQSEFAAVYFNRRLGSMSQDANPRFLAGNSSVASGKQAIRLDGASASSYPYGRGLSACSINLPYVKGDGNWSSRWFNMSTLLASADGNVQFDDGTNPYFNIDLTNTTLEEIFNAGYLYGANAISPSTDFTVLDPDYRRFKNNTPVLRIIASNEAKLPPIDGMADEDLYKVCQNFQVDVGVYDNNGNKLDGPPAPQRKRPMRRKEAIAMGAWPSTLQNSKIRDLEGGVANLTNTGTCNSHQRFNDATYSGFQGNQAEFGGLMPPAFGRNVGVRNTSTNQIILTSGSSKQDPVGYNGHNYETEDCVSKYGIQDLVGNVREHVSDQIHCNYSGVEMYLGIDGEQVNSINIGISSGLYDDRFLPSEQTPWSLATVDAGSCSLVEGNSVENTGSYRSGSIVNNIYDPSSGSGYDESQIDGDALKAFDQESILDGRNGDGSYLSFGINFLAPALAQPHALAFSSNGTKFPNQQEAALGAYFNPVYGIVLHCRGTTCDLTPDNKIFTMDGLSGLPQNATADYTNIIVSNYPVGDSEFYSDGMIDIRSSTTAYAPPRNGYGPTTYIDSINPGGFPNHTTASSGDYVGPELAINRSLWVADRNRPMNIFHGGSSFLDGSGRYTAQVKSISLSAQRRDPINSGAFGRCVLKINED